MELNTYRSEAVPRIYVTVPSAEADATLAMVDRLASLRFKLVRLRYRLPAKPADLDFLARVTTQIAATGYALHGFEPAAQGGRV